MSDNVIFVGNKPVMSYVLAVVTQFNQGASQVCIRARGKSISRAVDAAEIVINKFRTDVKKSGISTFTEAMDTDDGKTNVSGIEIWLNLDEELKDIKQSAE